MRSAHFAVLLSQSNTAERGSMSRNTEQSSFCVYFLEELEPGGASEAVGFSEAVSPKNTQPQQHSSQQDVHQHMGFTTAPPAEIFQLIPLLPCHPLGLP